MFSSPVKLLLWFLYTFHYFSFPCLQLGTLRIMKLKTTSNSSLHKQHFFSFHCCSGQKQAEKSFCFSLVMNLNTLFLYSGSRVCQHSESISKSQELRFAIRLINGLYWSSIKIFLNNSAFLFYMEPIKNLLKKTCYYAGIRTYCGSR